MKSLLLLLLILIISFGCNKKADKPKVWIYTSLYKDTVTDIKAQLEKKFPDVEVQFYQAGSEEVASKVQAELLSGKIQADIIIASDRFWYEDMAKKGLLLSYKPAGSEQVGEHLKSPFGFYTTVSLPMMVLAYNSESVKAEDAPKSFKELTEAKWKDKVSMGSPLASGTTFTTVAFIVKKYGWDYFTALRKNNLIAEGGNSGVIRRLQSKERPVGIVLLENLLRLTTSDPRIKAVIPSDGAIIQVNALGIVKKDGDQLATKKIADWMFTKEGQVAMVNSFMYSTAIPDMAAPVGAPSLSEIMKNSADWSADFLTETMQSREKIKDQFSKIVF